MLQVKVKVVGIERTTMLPVVVLTDETETGFLSLVIGPAEAGSISVELADVASPRPNSHDLMLSMIDAADARVERMIITDIVDDTYYAKVLLRTRSGVKAIDARPSDGIALALRADAPIFVSEAIVAKAMVQEFDEDQEMDAFREFLDSTIPEDFKDFFGSSE